MTDATIFSDEPRKLEWIGVTPRQLAGFIAMVFGMFMAILDIQIVSASLQEIQAGISASADEIPWVQTSYLIAEVIMIPLSGFLSRVFSTRALFVTAAIGFTAASALCATATSINEMIIFRAIQGFYIFYVFFVCMVGYYVHVDVLHFTHSTHGIGVDESERFIS